MTTMKDSLTIKRDSAKKSEASLMMKKPRGYPKISALICTLNEEENLPQIITRIPQWVDEVLLVDGHSKDKTVETARNIRPDIKVLYQPGRGKGGFEHRLYQHLIHRHLVSQGWKTQIEGRMKSAFYHALATRAYREAIDYYLSLIHI